MSAIARKTCSSLVGSAALWALAGRVAAAPANAGTEGVRGELVGHVSLGLMLVLVAIVAVAWVMRRVFQIAPGMHGQLRVLGGISMGGRERAVLLQVGETQLLVGVAPGRVQTLHVLERPLVSESPAPTSEGFANQLAHALQRISVRGRGSD